MDCRQVNQLLPLWIGQDLPDSSSADQVVNHLRECRGCDQRRISIQSSLDVLHQSMDESLATQPDRQSVWPGLLARISNWEGQHHRGRFNGWIPASVMALAAGLMVAVSLPSVSDELFSGPSQPYSSQNLFSSDPRFQRNDKLENERATDVMSHRGDRLTKPVKFTPDQW